MLQTVTGTEPTVALETKLRPKKSAMEVVFDIIRDELADNGGETGVALEVALAHIKTKRLAKDIFNERGLDILRHLWNNHAGVRWCELEYTGVATSGQKYPEPPKQVKGARAKVKRYTVGSVFDKWAPIGSSGKSKLLGDLEEKDLDIIIKAYDSHIEGTAKNKAKWERMRELLIKSKKKRVRDGLTAKEIVELELPGRQLK